MLEDFKDFLLRGNVVELAVAVVIGAAFGAVVTALVRDILTPIIAIPGGADFSGLTFTINGSTFRYGHFFNAVISFVIIAAAVFFLVMRPLTTLMSRLRTETDVETETVTCPHCISSIPGTATVCAFCTRDVNATT